MLCSGNQAKQQNQIIMSELKNSLRSASERSLRERAALRIGVWQFFGHLVGVLVVGGLIALPFMSAETMLTMWELSRFTGVRAVIGIEGFLHLGISACVWALLVILFHAVRPDPRHVSRRFRATRGTVLTETLIAMPVALLLTFGLAQLAVMNIAGILANLASVQAGRAAWLWYPEVESGRQNVSHGEVEDRVRIQASMTLAPAAPGDFVLTGTEGSDLFKQMRGSLVGAQLDAPSSDAGSQGMARAQSLAKAEGDAQEDRAFNIAIDGSTFLNRTARKFTFAYLATSVELLTSGDQVGARIKYKQLCAFPVVSKIFGEPGTVGARTGRYSEITREFTLRKQLESNENKPRQ